MLELFEVFFNGEAGRDRANNDANENHDGVDGDESVRFEILRDLGNVDTVTGEVGFDETETNYDNGGGEEARDDTADFGFNEEGSANKAGVSTNQTHHLDLFTTREDGHADSIENNEDRNN